MGLFDLLKQYAGGLPGQAMDNAPDHFGEVAQTDMNCFMVPSFTNVPSKLARSRSRIRRMVASCDLRWMHGPVAAVASGDGETHCSMFRSDEVWDGTSCGAKQ